MGDVVQYFTEAVTGLKAALDLYKGAKSELAHDAAKKADAEIAKAEIALKNGEAELAKKLGFRLCRCEFPPPIMLWDKGRRKSVCPKCGDIYPPDTKQPQVRIIR
jgi:hypothetical protein